jgi:hypothetical protein
LIRLSPGATVFANCDWPPPGYADQTGYSEIRIAATDGVSNASEAAGDGLADRIVSTCSTLSLAYTFGAQGAETHYPPFTARPGDFVTPTGEPWTGDRRQLRFYPGRNEVVVLRNDKSLLDVATCVS